MRAYRSTLAGGGEGYNAESYTLKITTNGETTLAPGSCRSMFEDNATFNEFCLIGGKVNTCAWMFNNCTNFNQDVHISKSVNNCQGMLMNALNFGKNVYFHFRENAINARYLFSGANNSIRKNVFFQPNMNEYFNYTTGGTIAGGGITWAEMTNGFYNSTYNIYCYNNYVG